MGQIVLAFDGVHICDMLFTLSLKYENKNPLTKPIHAYAICYLFSSCQHCSCKELMTSHLGDNFFWLARKYLRVLGFLFCDEVRRLICGIFLFFIMAVAGLSF